MQLETISIDENRKPISSKNIFDESIHEKVPINFQKSPEALPPPNHYIKLKWFAIILSGITVLISIYFFMLRSFLFKRLIITLENYLKRLYTENLYRFVLEVNLILVGVASTCLGSHLLISIIVATVIQNFWISFVILLTGSVIGDLFCYFIAKYLCKNWLTSKFEGNIFYNVLIEESKNEPFKTAFLTRVIMIPVGVKNYILALIENPIHSYVISGICMDAFYITEACLIAREFTEISSMLDPKRGWKEKSTSEKVSFILMMVVLVVTIGVVISAGVWATQKVKRKRLAQKLSLNEDPL